MKNMMRIDENRPVPNLLPKEVLERLGQKEDFSFMQFSLELEGRKLGYLGFPTTLLKDV
jgi:hypothetical protein